LHIEIFRLNEDVKLSQRKYESSVVIFSSLQIRFETWARLSTPVYFSSEDLRNLVISLRCIFHKLLRIRSGCRISSDSFANHIKQIGLRITSLCFIELGLQKGLQVLTIASCRGTAISSGQAGRSSRFWVSLCFLPVWKGILHHQRRDGQMCEGN
jgi:hypothetical protein